MAAAIFPIRKRIPKHAGDRIRTGASPHKSISQLKVARCHITLNCHLLAPPHSVRVLKLPACASTSHSWARFSYASAAPEVAALILGSFTWVATERISSARARQCFGSLTSLRSCLFTRTSSLATWPATRRMRTLSFFPMRLRTRQDVLFLLADGNSTVASGRPALLATKSVPRIHGQRSRLHRKLNPEWSFLQCLSKSAPLQESRGRSDATTQRRCE